MRKLRRVGNTEDDPLAGVANFFDLGVILALAFMVPLIARLAMDAQSASALPAPDAARQIPLERYQPSTDPLQGEGERLGVAYRLKSGEVVYVPEPASPRTAPQTAPRQTD